MSSEAFTIDLPSRGVLYGGRLPGGKVSVRPMGEAEENLLFQQGGDPVAKIQRILDNCYLDGDKVEGGDLLMIDRFYILLMLRVQMFGAVYTIPFRCQSCRDQRKLPVNLMDELDKKDMDDDASEPFMTTLPHCGKEVGFRLLRGKDETAIARKAKRVMMKSADAEDPSNRLRIAKQIMTVDGEELEEKAAEAFASSLDMCDANEFRLATEAVEGGIDLTLFIDCKACGYVNEMVMPFTAEFLRPSTRVT